MATGSGKTRTVIALCDLLIRCNWAKRVLFLADRVALVKQATNAFKAFLPDSSPVNLVTEKDSQGRVYLSTYPTMMGMIDDAKDGQKRFSVGHFDLVVIDEARRRLRDLVQFIEKAFLREHLDIDAVRKLRTNEPLTRGDLDDLERILNDNKIGNDEFISQAKQESEGFGIFVRSLVGLDREVAKKLFGEFLLGGEYNSNQIEFINLIINQLVDHGISAINDVRKANIGADVLRVDECNLVTASEIARRIGRSRQLVHQHMTGQRGPGGLSPRHGPFS